MRTTSAVKISNLTGDTSKMPLSDLRPIDEVTVSSEWGLWNLSTLQKDCLPSSFDLRQFAGTIENQLTTGSCVANATVSLFEILLAMRGTWVDLSRLYIYYYGREARGIEDIDGGMGVTDGIFATDDHGICEEPAWPFIVENVNLEPSQESQLLAEERKGVGYYFFLLLDELDTIKNIKLALTRGYPVLFGLKLAESFYDLDGAIALHDYEGVTVADPTIGNHGMIVVAFDNKLNGGSVIVENSWSTDFGDAGYCAIPYSVFFRDCFDLRIVKRFAENQLTDEEAAINGLYMTILGRQADAGGLAWYLEQHLAGMSLRDIARSSYYSGEYANAHPNEDFVTKAYHQILGREPDDAGLQYWLGSGFPENVVRDIFMNTTEFLTGW